MESEELKQRTKTFAINIVRFFKILPKNDEARIIGKQLLRCATSVGANYRAACRSRSKAEFYAKLCIVVEECDESIFWLELLGDTRIIGSEDHKEILKEANELLYIFSSSRKTVKTKLNYNKHSN
jgi:four helix bundle protein